MRNQLSASFRVATWRRNPAKSYSKRVRRSSVQELYHQGFSASEIAQARGVQEQTVLEQLAELILKGKSVDINRFVPEDGQLEIIKTLRTIGPGPLRNIYDHLEERYTYGQIRLVLSNWKQWKQHDEVQTTVKKNYPDTSYENYAINDSSKFEASLGSNRMDLSYLEDINRDDDIHTNGMYEW